MDDGTNAGEGDDGNGERNGRPEAIILVGIQASGKTTFYSHRFFSSHVRINLDMLKTRYREHHLFTCCCQYRIPLVVDNTNPRKKDRQRYIPTARENGFSITGY